MNATGATAPDPLSIALENATCTTHTVQMVMESAADANNAYKFTVSFSDKATGYTIDILSGLGSASDCEWYLFYRAPGASGPTYKPNARISYFVVAPNSTVVLSYEPEPTLPPSPSPSPSPTPSPGPDDNNGGPQSLYNTSMAVALSCLMAAAVVALL